MKKAIVCWERKIEMKKMIKMLPYLLAYLLIYYLLPLPLFNSAPWWGMDCLMIYMPILSLIIGIVYGANNGFSIFLPIMSAIIFMHADWIHYDELLYGYAIIYAIISLIGIILGKYTQKCSNCSSKFKRKNIIKSVWLRGYSPILCENCNTKHYCNVLTRLIVGLSIGGPIFILNRFHYGYYVLLGYIFWLALVIYLTPSYARYHLKAENEE